MKKIAVVTGASSGIGKAFAELLAKEGYELYLVARGRERLQELEQSLDTKCHLVIADLKTDEGIQELTEYVKDISVDLFINCAGYGIYGTFADIEVEQELGMLELNVRTMHILMKFMLQKMKKQNAGMILNVASLAGLTPGGPYMATYYASKAYVASLSRSVAKELREEKSPVRVACLCPGPVNTNFNNVADVEFVLKAITPEYCVSYAWKKLKRHSKKVVIVPGFYSRLTAFGTHMLPSSACLSIASALQKRKKKNK